MAEAVAVEIDYGVAHAQQSALVRQVLQSWDRRLRAQCALFRQASMPQRISIMPTAAPIKDNGGSLDEKAAPIAQLYTLRPAPCRLLT